MISILALGFLIGMRHSIEADHVAAVAALTTGTGSVRRAVPLGLLWGAGHTASLAAFAVVVIALGTALPANLGGYLEIAVGIMLIALGLDVLVRMIRERIHFHLHRHAGGVVHFHAHSHIGESRHRVDSHHCDHDHAHHRAQEPSGRLRVRAFAVGIMHGLAGSAALIVLSLHAMPSTLTAVLYVVLFGIGSIFGMAALTAVIAWPMGRAATTLTWLHNGAKAGIGTLTVGLGAAIVFEFRHLI